MRKRRMSGILETLASRESFATEQDWQEYQELLARLKMHTLEQAKDGQTIRPAQGFSHRQPSKRKQSIAAHVER